MDTVNEFEDKPDAAHPRETAMSNNLREQALLINAYRTAEERGAVLGAIVDSTDDAIISKDLNGIITSWNKSAERIFGYSAAEMIGTSILTLIPQDRLDEEPAILARLRNGERVDHFQTIRKRKDGKLIEVSLTISPVKNVQGVIIGVSKIARDVTAAREAEKNSAILSAIIASTDDAIISKDLSSIITSWNPAAARIFGYDPSEMIGESILKLIPPDRQDEETMILSKLRSGQRVEHFETKRLTKDGKLIDVSLTISPVKNASGAIIGVSKIARDITEKKLEEQRKNDFIAIVSHELKTPLTSLKSYVQLALIKAREREDKFSTNVLGRAEAQTRKMTTMIHDFLNLSRLEEGKMTLSPSNFSLTELMEDVISDALILAPDHLLDYQGCPEVDIYADRDKISQVMTNLLNNAAKYSANGSTITVRCFLNKGQANISFADQGIGISDADQKRLFERFYRVDNATTRQVSGFGIGLYLVSEILKLHGSKIDLTSKPDEGSVFSFALAV
jgi:two-component system sensor histidine kinase VicK